MKKTWNNPQVEELYINETAGGTAAIPVADGPMYQDDDKKWKQDMGDLGNSPVAR